MSDVVVADALFEWLADRAEAVGITCIGRNVTVVASLAEAFATGSTALA